MPKHRSRNADTYIGQPVKVKKGTTLEGIRQKVFIDRYAWKDQQGQPMEKHPEQMWARVAKALSKIEAPSKQAIWEKKFYEAMDNFKFVPAGRILSGAGTGHKVTFYNCFVLPCPEDSRGGIMENLTQMVEIMSRAGGVGINLSSLRPKGSYIKTVNGTSSGPIPWGELYSLATHEVIQQGGSRRGALMLMIDDHHPDVEEFITVKRQQGKLTGANLSVCISDKFMQAVKDDADWELHWNGKTFRTVKAKHLWDEICDSAWASAEPGLHFMERSNKRSNTWYYEKLISTNPCGEQPLGAWAVCNLGALNLSNFVDEETQQMDYGLLADHARVAIRALDNVVDANYYFFDENEKQQLGTRRTGLGTMGLGDALIKMQVRYGSEESLPVIDKIYRTIRDAAYDESAEIAKEKGPFPMFDREKYAQGWFIKRLPKEIQAKIKKYGIRNAVVLTQAPTGTTSLVSGASSGIEPVYDFAMKRTDRTGEHILYHELYKHWIDEHPDEEVPDYFVSANDLTPLEHVKVQAKIQEYTDSSISKTVNAPSDHTVKEVQDLYMAAYDMGLKGVTYMRDGSRQGVLEHIPKESEKPAAKDGTEPSVADTPTAIPHIANPNPVPRPKALSGKTVRVETAYGRMYVTMNTDTGGNLIEVFAVLGKAGNLGASMTEAITRLISTSLRAGVAPRAIIKELRGITDQPFGFGDNRVTSVADAIGKTMEDYLYPKLDLPESSQSVQTPVSAADQAAQVDTAAAAKAQAVATAEVAPPKSDSHSKLAGICPDCGGPLEFASGCKVCHSCGYSACG